MLYWSYRDANVVLSDEGQIPRELFAAILGRIGALAPLLGTTKMWKLRAILFLAAMLGAVTATASAEAFRSPHGFVIHLPHGWIEVPKAEIDRWLDSIRNAYPNAPYEEFDHAYRPLSNKHWLEYPRVAIQVRHTGKLEEPPEELFDTLKDRFVGEVSRKGDVKIAEILDDMPVFESVSIDQTLVDWDLERHIMWIAARSQDPNLGSIVGVMAICLTETGILRVGLAVEEAEFSTYMPVFREAVNSIEFSPKLKYQPVMNLTKVGSDRSGVIESAWSRMVESAGPILVLILVGAIVSAATAVVKSLGRKPPTDAED